MMFNISITDILPLCGRKTQNKFSSLGESITLKIFNGMESKILFRFKMSNYNNLEELTRAIRGVYLQSKTDEVKKFLKSKEFKEVTKDGSPLVVVVSKDFQP